MKKKLLAAAGLTLAVTALLYSLPYLTLYRIKAAVQASDKEALAGHIDFPAVRQSLIMQVESIASEEIRLRYGEDFLAKEMGRRLVSAAAEQLAERYITPEGILQLMQPNSGGPGKSGSTAAPEPVVPPAAPPAAQQSDTNLSRTGRYTSHDRFAFSVADDDGGAAVHFILTRSWLTWTLTRIELDI